MELRPLVVLVIMAVRANTVMSDDAEKQSELALPKKSDPKRRSAAVDQAFKEQKNVLLDMLESKLKEVQDKKKIKDSERANWNALKNVDVKLNSNGYSAIGDTNITIRFGDYGNGTLILNTTGVSQVGKAYLELGVAEGTINIPGLNDLFSGKSAHSKSNDGQNDVIELKTLDPGLVVPLQPSVGRRSGNDSQLEPTPDPDDHVATDGSHHNTRGESNVSGVPPLKADDNATLRNGNVVNVTEPTTTLVTNAANATGNANANDSNTTQSTPAS